MVAKSLHFCIIDLNTGISIIIDLDTSGCLDFQIFQNQDCWAFLIIAAANFYNGVARSCKSTIFNGHLCTICNLEIAKQFITVQIQNCIKVDNHLIQKI